MSKAVKGRGVVPKYTVMMAAKNSCATIESAVRSVLSHMPRDSEIVVWDDASMDNTAEIAKKAGGKRLRVIRSESSVGSGRARQNIISATDSEFVVNMDSDDISMPWRFRIQLPALDKADFTFTASLRFSNDSMFKKPTLPIGYTDGETRTSLAFHNTLTHSSLIARRSALMGIGGYGSYPVAQDYELWLRAASCGVKFRRVGVPCVAYRIGTSQVSSQGDYMEKIFRQPEIFHSYIQLINSLLPSGAPKLTPNEPYAESLERVSHVLPTLIQSFRPHLREYYRNLVKASPKGPFQGMVNLAP